MVRLVAMGFALLTVALFPVVGHCTLSINEIMADPATDWDGDGEYNYRDDEWVELYNAGPGHVNLGEFALSEGRGRNWTQAQDCRISL